MTVDIVPASTLLAEAPKDLLGGCFARRKPQGPTSRIIAVGDIGLSGRVAMAARETGYQAIFDEVAPVLSSGDVTFGNLEFALLPEVKAGMLFAASVEGAPALKQAGFTILNLANNHILDHGSAGLSSTLDALRTGNISCLGVGAGADDARQVVRTDIRELRIGWLGSAKTDFRQSGGPNFWEYNEAELIAAVSEAVPAVDFLVVSIHIGFMYLDYPHPSQKVFAERLIDAGASLVLMHHPHVLQGVQMRGRGTICYSLGNFLLDWQEGNVRGDVMVEEQQQSAVFVFELDASGICRMFALPTFIDERCCVRWAFGDRGQRILAGIARLSADLNGDFGPAFFRQRTERNTGHAVKVLLFHARRGNLRYVMSNLLKIRLRHAAQFFRWLYNKAWRRGVRADGSPGDGQRLSGS